MSDDTETLAEVLALARRARGGANFYAYTGSASLAMEALAKDLNALAARIVQARAGEGVETIESALRTALDTPLESPERQRLHQRWKDHRGCDGRLHPTITANCRFGSLLRDDVCQPAAPETVDGQANDCTHGSATGIDMAPCGPEKVWACDHCGLRWRQGGEPLARAGEGALREHLENIVTTLERGERVTYWATVEARAALTDTAGDPT